MAAGVATGAIICSKKYPQATGQSASFIAALRRCSGALGPGHVRHDARQIPRARANRTPSPSGVASDSPCSTPKLSAPAASSGGNGVAWPLVLFVGVPCAMKAQPRAK